MKVYLGNKGRNFFLMGVNTVEEQFRETYAFNSFGNLESTNGGVSSCDNWREVEFISLAGQGNCCEILSGEVKSKLNQPLMVCVSSIRNSGGYIGTIFSIPHEDNVGKYNQVIFVYDKGTNVKNIITSNFPSFGN